MTMSLRSGSTVLQALNIVRGGMPAVCCRGYKNAVTEEYLEKSRTSRLNKDRNKYIQDLQENVQMDKATLDEMRAKFPDFLPSPTSDYRDKLMERLERRDMYRRRTQIDIPEFYVGSVLAVTVSDKHSPGKKSRFLGICIRRGGHGLKHFFTLRNVIDNQGIEITYDMYSPLLQSIQVMKFEKRLDRHLIYLRDCPLEYSTFPQDMEGDTILESMEPKLNTIKVPLNPRPWSQRWEREDLQGVQEFKYASERTEKKLMKLKSHPHVAKLWEKEDIMKHYRETINPVEAGQVMTEVRKRKEKKWK